MKSELDKKTIPILRSFNQQITASGFKTAKEITAWMGAIQAQDYNMAKWALGIRLRNSTEVEINNEIDAGGIIRTHLLRPTWHFVSSDDIYWMQELTAPHIRSSVKSREKQLGLTDSVLRKCFRLFEKTLRDGNHKTRGELIRELMDSRIRVDNNRASHIFLRAEIEGLICSGKQKGGAPTYAILQEWVPGRNKTYRDEALKKLALRYYTSRGPATVSDFSWWSGLSLSNSRLALELSKPDLISETIENQTYWLAEPSNLTNSVTGELYLLPAFDEFLIGYRDRTASLLKVDNKKTISDNGIFYPAILSGGQITGTWKRNIKGNRITLIINLFKTGVPASSNNFAEPISMYSKFYNKIPEILLHPDYDGK